MSGPDNINPDFSRSALLIAAHGAPAASTGQASTRRHTAAIKSLNIFADVQAGFLSEAPFVSDVLKTFKAETTYVVPNLACAGFIASHKLPLALADHPCILTEPVGTHEQVPKLMAQSVLTALQQFKVDITDASLIVVGHGSGKSRESFLQTQTVAAALIQHGVTLPTSVAYWEEAPLISDPQNLRGSGTIIVAPFLISDGSHGSVDVPASIGFDPHDEAFKNNLAQGLASEVQNQNQRVIYLPPVGDDVAMTDIILDLVYKAQRSSR